MLNFKKLLCVVFSIAVMMSSVCVYATDSVNQNEGYENEIVYPEIYLDDLENDSETRAVSSNSITFKRESNTSGTGSVRTTVTQSATYIKATITLQSAPADTTNFSNTSQTATKTVYDTTGLSKSFSFTITKAKEYRVKVVIKHKINGTVYTNTYYKKLT